MPREEEDGLALESLGPLLLHLAAVDRRRVELRVRHRPDLELLAADRYDVAVGEPMADGAREERGVGLTGKKGGF